MTGVAGGGTASEPARPKSTGFPPRANASIASVIWSGKKQAFISGSDACSGVSTVGDPVSSSAPATAALPGAVRGLILFILPLDLVPRPGRVAEVVGSSGVTELELPGACRLGGKEESVIW